MNGNEVRDAGFLTGRERGFLAGPPGYGASEVDGLLRRIAAELDAGRPVRPLITSATFRPRSMPGYDVDAVDWFLDQISRRTDDPELADKSRDPWRDLAVVNQFIRHGASDSDATEDRRYLAQECAGEWRDFGQQPGTYLRAAWVGAARYELRAMEAQTIASVRGHLWFMPRFVPKTVRAGGRSFTFRMTAPAGSSQGIAEIAARSAQDGGGHFAANTMSSRKQEAEAKAGARARFAELADGAGTPILYISGMNFDRRACARISFPDQRWLRFLVRGTEKANAIMTAVDQAGNKVARYRLIRRGFANWRNIVEITVHPGRQLTDELVLAIAISTRWLGEYFDVPGGGGG